MHVTIKRRLTLVRYDLTENIQLFTSFPSFTCKQTLTLTTLHANLDVTLQTVDDDRPSTHPLDIDILQKCWMFTIWATHELSQVNVTCIIILCIPFLLLKPSKKKKKKKRQKEGLFVWWRDCLGGGRGPKFIIRWPGSIQKCAPVSRKPHVDERFSHRTFHDTKRIIHNCTAPSDNFATVPPPTPHTPLQKDKAKWSLEQIPNDWLTKRLLAWATPVDVDDLLRLAAISTKHKVIVNCCNRLFKMKSVTVYNLCMQSQQHLKVSGLWLPSPCMFYCHQNRIIFVDGSLQNTHM